MIPRPPLVRALVTAALLAELAGCEAGHSTRPTAALVTLFDWEAKLQAGDQPAGAGLQDLFPSGVKPSYLLDDGAATPTVKVLPAFVDGGLAAYISTDFWFNYTAVWIQPMYVLITGWTTAGPTLLPQAAPIFSVGPSSGFYSPYWRVYYAQVPVGTAPDHYRRVKQIFDDHLPLTPGPGKLCTLVPNNTQVAATQPVVNAIAGPTVNPIGQPRVAQGWVDGEPDLVAVFDFGANRFTWNEDGEVAEVPLFVLTLRDPTDPSRFIDVGLPRIGGTSDTPGFTAGAPNFGSLWRLYRVRLPEPVGTQGPAIFAPPNVAELEATIATLKAAAPQLFAADAVIDPQLLAKKADLARAYALRVALNPACFAVAADFPDKCRWLDSQAALEQNLPAAIDRTDILANCPLVTYDGAAVTPP